MNITLSQEQNDGSDTKSKIQTKFERLWDSVKKKQKRNNKLKQELDELLVAYNQTVLPKEREYVQPLCALLEKLTVFYSRKSLAQWQREELGEWMSELIYQLSQYDAEKAQLSAEKFQRVFCEYHEISEQALKDDQDLYQEELNSDKPHQTPPEEEDMFEFEDKNKQDEDPDFSFDESHQDDFEVEPTKRESPALNEKWIRKLFRRTAQALHPDKEQDPKKRAQKQVLMSELLSARDKQDVMTMMMLYNQHVSDAELALAEEEMKSLCEMLVQQQHQLDSGRYDIIYQTPLHASIHESLYAASEKTRLKKLKQHLKNVQEGINQQTQLVEYLNNLTQLKKVLEERADRFEPMGW